MNITLGGKPITTDQLRDLSFALLSLAQSIDRYHVQLAQSQAAPADSVERAQADRAAQRAIESMRKARRLITEATR